MLRRLCIGLIALATLCAAGAEVRAQDRFYVVVFGAQPHPKQLRRTHAWATFVRVSGDPADPNAPCWQHTISWLPATLEIRPLAAHPEPGVNLDLDRTLAVMRDYGAHTTAWGPIEIGPDLYNRSLAVKARLESGQVGYRALTSDCDLLMDDCNHAVASAGPEFGRHNSPLFRAGKPAGRRLARQVARRGEVGPGGADASWLLARLGLPRQGVEVVSP
ncbi:hypothetical protein [Paludisphaera soli]|uniref:hypothetical protein n=1 Tax=Paludisphaera soli TaxID=2712865 RepID=UPI0013EC530F|nr:hypothetical protein [Paludisphaera soli]